MLVPVIFLDALDRTTPIVIPRTTGPYAEGRKCFHWVDSSRPEYFTPDLKAKRELLLGLWCVAVSGIRNRTFAEIVLRIATFTPGYAYLIQDPVRRTLENIHRNIITVADHPNLI
jgi:hypothetical protein